MRGGRPLAQDTRGVWPRQLDGGNGGARGAAGLASSSGAAPAATDAAMETYGAAAEPVSLVAAPEAPSEPVADFERSTFGGSLGDGGAAPAEAMDAATPNGGDELMQGEDCFSRPLDIMAASGRAAARRRTNGIPPWQRRRSIQPAKYERGDK